jgi:hypothetical protein
MQRKSLICVMCCLLMRDTVVPNALLCAARKKEVAMKRFPSEDSNQREGRQLIHAHSNAEEEAPLGLSFEDKAEARTFSRRQALGLLGGSLAGATVLSFGLADPAKSTHVPGHPTFRNFDHITLESEGGYLDGRIQDGTVGLAPHTNPPFTGTRWEAVQANPGKWPPNEWWFFCRATWPRPAGAPYYESGPRWLDGRTHNGTVGLAPTRSSPYTGTKWKVHADRRWNQEEAKYVEYVVLESFGQVPGNRLLVARRAPDTPVWSLGLAPVNSALSGRFWRFRQLSK